MNHQLIDELVAQRIELIGTIQCQDGMRAFSICEYHARHCFSLLRNSRVGIIAVRKHLWCDYSSCVVFREFMASNNTVAGRLLRTLSLDVLRGFEAAARQLSFTAAAEELCLTQSAVSKQVKALEAAMSTLEFRGQFLRELRGRYLLASAGILTRPQRRKISGALAFGFGTQGSDGRRGQGKSRRRSTDWAKLFHEMVHDAARGSAGEKVRKRCVTGRLAL